MKRLSQLLLLVLLASGCDNTVSSQEELERIAGAVIGDNVQSKVQGATNSYWMISNLKLDQAQPTTIDEDGDKRSAVSLKVRADTMTCSYSEAPREKVVYADLDSDLTVQIYKDALRQFHYKVIDDRTKVGETVEFNCGGADHRVVRGIVSKVDVEKATLTLYTNQGIFSAAIPDHKIALLMADQFRQGLAVALHIDKKSPRDTDNRVLYVELQ